MNKMNYENSINKYPLYDNHSSTKTIGPYLLSRIIFILASTLGKGTFGKVKTGIHIATGEKVKNFYKFFRLR